MAKSRMTPFARLFLFLVILLPASYAGALYFQGKDPVKEITTMVKGESSSSNSSSSSRNTTSPADEIKQLKAENQELRQRVEELEKALKEKEDAPVRQKWGK